MRKKMVPFLAIFLTLTCACSDTVGDKNNIAMNSMLKEKAIQDTAFANETAYQGSDAPAALYDIEFKKTDAYVPNIDFISNISTEEFQTALNTTSKYISKVYGNSYITILNDVKPTETNLHFIGIIGDYEETVPKLSIEELYVDNKIDALASFESDRSLIYKDMFYHILRGTMSVTVYGEEQCKAYSDYFGILVEDGVQTSIICEAYFIPNQYETVTDFYILSYLEE